MSTKNLRKQSIVRLVSGLFLLLALNVLADFYFLRFDLTAEKRYSISESSKKLAGKLSDVVYVKVYLDGDLPPGFKRLRNATQEMLDEFRIYAGDNIEYSFIDPAAGKGEKERLELYKQLAKKGLFPTNLEVQEDGKKSEKIIFPGALVTYGNAEVPLQLLKSQMGSSSEEMLNSSVEGLEYEIASAIRRLTQPIAKHIGFLRGHGEADNEHITDAARSLSEYYKVDTVLIAEQLGSLSGFDALIIAKPLLPFSEKDKFILDQFIMKGGKVLWLLDGMAIDMDSLTQNSTTIAMPAQLNLEDQLFRYGARVNPDLLMDLQAGPIPVVTGYTGNTPRQELFPWPYFPLTQPSGSHPIVNNLNLVKSEFGSSVDTIEVPDVRKTILLTTSDYARIQMPPARVSLNILQQEPDQRQYNKRGIPFAVLLEGRFTSNFRNRIPDAIRESKEIDFRETGDSTRMIIVGDGDVVVNHVSKQGALYPLGYDRFTRQSYGNRNFILNCIDYLCDDSGVIGLRGKEIRLRLLDQAQLEESDWVRWANVLSPLLLLIIAGTVHHRLRKSKYTRP
jgi:gliding-associated putative ABC transporter substrate-binding component GldG